MPAAKRHFVVPLVFRVRLCSCVCNLCAPLVGQNGKQKQFGTDSTQLYIHDSSLLQRVHVPERSHAAAAAEHSITDIIAELN